MSCRILSTTLLMCFLFVSTVSAQVAIHGEKVYTAVSDPIEDGVVLIRDGKIDTIGKADSVKIPDGFDVLKAKVVVPGLIDAHSTVGFSGILNVDHDQDQLERSSPIQPELRALDAYNAHEELVDWVRSFGVTTIHTGHAPGELISGQTLIVKTAGNTVDAAKIMETRAVAATLSSSARKNGGKSPGTRGKMMSMLRAELIKAREYQRKHSASKEAASPGESDGDESSGDESDEDKKSESKGDAPARDLRMETLSKVLANELPLMITAQKAQDISNALRLANEFQFTLWLDGAAEAYLLIDDIKDAKVPVLIHPTMVRPNGELENASFETAAKLIEAGVPVAFQAGYEAYVPKTRIVLFEAAMAAANGLSFEQTLAAITIDAARILEIDKRVGSLEVGKDGDVALFDGDPFEYTTHCVGVVIDGQVVSRTKR